MHRTPLLLALLVAAACSSDPVSPTAAADPVARYGKAVSGTIYAYTVSGDIRSAEGHPAPTKRVSNGSPFKNLSLSSVTLTVGFPTGTECAATRTYASSFGANEGLTFSGSMGRASTGTLNFLGTRVGGTEQFQITISDQTGGPVETANPDGSWTLSYTSAASYSDSRTTYFDGLYRCVNVTVTAIP